MGIMLKIFIFFMLFMHTSVYAQSEHMNHENHKDHEHHKTDQMRAPHSFDESMGKILTEYLRIYNILLSGKTDHLKEMSENIAQMAKKLDLTSVASEHAGHYNKIPINLVNSSESLGRSGDISSAREAFRKLSQPMAMWVSMARPTGYAVMFCPMVKASWVQKEGQVQNPYDEAMPHCGDKV
ncbi:MAG: DUF3347 domain-containing protein [Deltaproteobacteria bacterium]|nr:DUF3347 domain-containing protein [Deltaproteobacteria bacterium]